MVIFIINSYITATDTTLSPKKCPPPKKKVKYSNTHNTEQKSLKITENTLTSI